MFGAVFGPYVAHTVQHYWYQINSMLNVSQICGPLSGHQKSERDFFLTLLWTLLFHETSESYQSRTLCLWPTFWERTPTDCVEGERTDRSNVRAARRLWWIPGGVGQMSERFSFPPDILMVVHSSSFISPVIFTQILTRWDPGPWNMDVSKHRREEFH